MSYSYHGNTRNTGSSSNSNPPNTIASANQVAAMAQQNAQNNPLLAVMGQNQNAANAALMQSLMQQQQQNQGGNSSVLPTLPQMPNAAAAAAAAFNPATLWAAQQQLAAAMLLQQQQHAQQNIGASASIPTAVTGKDSGVSRRSPEPRSSGDRYHSSSSSSDRRHRESESSSRRYDDRPSGRSSSSYESKRYDDPERRHYYEKREESRRYHYDDRRHSEDSSRRYDDRSRSSSSKYDDYRNSRSSSSSRRESSSSSSSRDYHHRGSSREDYYSRDRHYSDRMRHSSSRDMPYRSSSSSTALPTHRESRPAYPYISRTGEREGVPSPGYGQYNTSVGKTSAGPPGAYRGVSATTVASNQSIVVPSVHHAPPAPAHAKAAEETTQSQLNSIPHRDDYGRDPRDPRLDKRRRLESESKPSESGASSAANGINVDGVNTFFDKSFLSDPWAEMSKKLPADLKWVDLQTNAKNAQSNAGSTTAPPDNGSSQSAASALNLLNGLKKSLGQSTDEAPKLGLPQLTLPIVQQKVGATGTEIYNLDTKATENEVKLPLSGTTASNFEQSKSSVDNSNGDSVDNGIQSENNLGNGGEEDDNVDETPTFVDSRTPSTVVSTFDDENSDASTSSVKDSIVEYGHDDQKLDLMKLQEHLRKQVAANSNKGKPGVRSGKKNSNSQVNELLSNLTAAVNRGTSS